MEKKGPMPSSAGGANLRGVVAATAAFVLSGGAGLIYESVWSRYLGLLLGHAAYAQVLVLATFLGGMAVGSLAAARLSERLRSPLLWYAAAELAVAVSGLVFHPVFVAVTGWAYGHMLPALAGSAAALPAKWALAAALIAPQSVLLGTTFPLMSAGLLRLRGHEPGRILSSLYAANSFGGAAAVLVAGFVLVPAVGLPGTVLAGAMASAMAAAIAYLLGRSAGPGASGTAAGRTGAVAGAGAGSGRDRRLLALLLFVAAGTAAASFGYEIAWIRMLSLALGSATHSFELMLSAFIAGMAGGALWMRGRADGWRDPLRALAAVQWLMGAVAILSLIPYALSFPAMRWLMAAGARTEEGYVLFTVSRYALCLAVMVPSTLFTGMTLPLLTRILYARGWGERSVGWVYGVNTLGSIVGAALAGLACLPLLGLRGTLAAAAALDMALGIALLGKARFSRPGARLRAGAVAAVVTALLIGAVLRWVALDRTILISGVFRSGRLPNPGSVDVLYYRDGRTATVSVTRFRSGRRSVATNGKPDASLSSSWFTGSGKDGPERLIGDESTQALSGLIALAHNPGAGRAAVVGFGSGMTSHFLLGARSGLVVDTIEIEPEMVRAGRLFYPANRRVFDDARSRIVIEDARAFLAEHPQPYDLIVSEPSNPWVSGVASLFSDEFYAMVRRHLADRGIFAQWVQAYEISDPLVLSVLSAVHRNFADYQVYMTAAADVLIVASARGPVPEPDWSIFDARPIREDLDRFRPLDHQVLEALRIAGRRSLGPLVESWRAVNSDFFPVLDTGAERSRFLSTSARGLLSLGATRFSPEGFLGARRGFFSHPRAFVGGVDQVERLVRGARVRAAAASGFAAAAAEPGSAGEELHDVWAWDRSVRLATPPPSWPAWFRQTRQVEEWIHGGTMGVADPWFYGRLRSYIERVDAPPAVRAAADYLEGVARCDAAGVAAACETLVKEFEDGREWIPAAELYEACSLANLLEGNAGRARRIAATLDAAAARSGLFLRRELIRAYLEDPHGLAAAAAANEGPR